MAKSMMTVIEENAMARESQRLRIDELILECARKDRQINQLWNDHQNLKQHNAMLRQRPDLPIERIPVYKEMREAYRLMKEAKDMAAASANSAIERCKELAVERDEAFDMCDELRNQLDNMKGT